MSSIPESSRNVGRPWTEDEDRLLIEAVKVHGERDNWKTIALAVPGRSNKACRKRWLHSLSPTIKKTAWTPDEDRILLDLIRCLGPKWSAIAREIPGRTDDACSKRYREALDPSLKKDEWTCEEDVKLMEAFGRVGGKWGQVGQELQRSGLACRNRWRLLERKKAHRAGQGNTLPQGNQPQISILDPSSHSDIPGLLLQTETIDGSLSPSQDSWLTFYTPEQYTSPLEDSYQMSNDICLPVSQAEVQNAPFQFSSSSLSAALSDPYQFSVSPMSALQLIEDRCDQGSPPSSLSPVSANQDLIYGVEDHPMSFCDIGGFHDSLELGRILSQVGFNSPAIHNDQTLDVNNNGAAVSPLFSPQDMSQPTALPPQGSPWTPLTPFEAFGLSPLSPPHRLQHYNNLPFEENLYDDLSSTNSTPLNFLSSLSPTSSPGAISPIDLPTTEPQTTGSLLFSPTQKLREPSLDTHRRPRGRKAVIRRALKPPGTARLSASLTIASDPSIKPYACGRPQCWPDSPVCFSTSRELFEHCKTEHEPEDIPCETPFRCGLAGCDKSWKTLNGLQYHLQISTAHFRHALSSKFSSQQLRRNEGSQGSATRGSSSDTEASEEAKRIYVCRHPNCFKAYKQPSGLRYHLKHGHPANMPAQLSVVPPVLARQLPEKAKKMRRTISSSGLEANQ